MRVLAVVLVGVLLLGGCSSVGGGRDDDAVPPGDAWRTDVVSAIARTPGVTSTAVSVNDVDSGTGHEGPVLTGYFVVARDSQAVVDAVLRRVSDVLGEDSAGVRISLAVTDDSGPRRRLRDFGYDGVSNGRSLWDATR